MVRIFYTQCLVLEIQNSSLETLLRTSINYFKLYAAFVKHISDNKLGSDLKNP